MLREQDLTWSIGGSVKQSREVDELRDLCGDNAVNAMSVPAQWFIASLSADDLSQNPCSK
jgi:hypothetical protein